MRSNTLLLVTGALLLFGGGAAVYTMTRGLRNNNPGNIRDDGVTAWEGIDTPRGDGEFLRFTRPEYGIRALARTLSNYIAHDGVAPTVSGIISRLAPPNENDTQAYIDKVSGDLSIAPDQLFDLPTVLPDLIASIISEEQGFNPYSEATILTGINLA